MDRLQIGLMVPQDNTTMEAELLRWLPAGTQCSTVRIPRGNRLLTSGDVPNFVSHSMRLAEGLADASLDVVVYGCASLGIIAGPRQDAEFTAALSDTTGRPVISAAGAMVAALHHADASDVALVTPYSEAINEKLTELLFDEQINVRRISSFDAGTVERLTRIEAKDVAARALETMDEDCDALFIACAHLPTFPIMALLLREFQRPVMSTVQACAWRVRQQLDLDSPRH
jgi:maleate cis-trans isomerase